MELKFNLYVVFDKVSGSVVSTHIFANDGLAVRQVLLSLRCPIRDTEIYQIGNFQEVQTKQMN